MSIRFAFIGLDHWYNALPTLEALKQSPDAEVVALAHRDAARADEIGRRYDVLVAPDYDAVIGRDDIDVVCVFTSADEVAQVSIDALEAGNAVVAIKPMAMNLADADRVVEAARRSGGRYFPNDAARRFFPANVQFKGWVEEGKIGDLLSAHCVFRAGLPREWPDATTPGWFADPSRTPGGAFIDHAIYHVDLLRWLFGAEVESVTGMIANVRHRDISVEDYGHAVLRFANGAMGSIEDTWTSGPGAPREAFEVVGSRGSLINDTATGRMLLNGEFGLSGWIQTPAPALRSSFIGHVIRMMQGNEQAASGAEEARTNLAVCLAVYEAARSGGEVKLGVG
ncbi:MAG: Gfo/Idh/MocA family protein, partial [Dehalococcoidia bacterium]